MLGGNLKVWGSRGGPRAERAKRGNVSPAVRAGEPGCCPLPVSHGHSYVWPSHSYW